MTTAAPSRRRSLYFDPPRYPFRPVVADDHVHPVVVVGAGPVGLYVALELGRRDIPVVVLDAKDSVSEGSRAACISRRSVELFQRAGVADRFMAEALGWTSGTSFYRERPVFRLEMPHGDDERFFPMANLQQNLLEALLVEEATRYACIDVRWQSRVADYVESTGGGVLDVATPDGTYRLRARYVVAADGARSTMRSLLGLALEGETYAGRYLIADIKMESSHPTERRAWFDPPSNPGHTVLMHKQPRDIWRIDYQLDEQADDKAELAEPRVRERIQRHLDWIGEPASWELEWVSLYRAHCLALRDFRHRNVFFAGDAAHLVPIFGVRGLNSGLADAGNLAWKLAAAIRGSAGPGLLPSYSTERRAAIFDVFANARKSTLFMSAPTPARRLMRTAALELAVTEGFVRPLVNPRQSVPFDYGDSSLTTTSTDAASDAPLPGAPLPNVRLREGSAQGAFLLDLLGPEATLLVFVRRDHDAAKLLAEVAEDVRPWTTLVTIGSTAAADVADRDGHVAEKLGAVPGSAILVRPDGHIAACWPAASAGAVAAAVARMRGDD